MDFIIYIIHSIPFDLILNIILVSVPEELFFVSFSLILLKQFEFLRFSKGNIKRILFVILPPAIFSNIIRTIPYINSNYMPIIGIILITLFIMITYMQLSIKQLFKTAICVILSFVIAMTIELSYFPLLMYGTSVNLEDLNKPGVAIFIFMIPERLIEYSLVVYTLLRRRSFSKINLITYSFRHKGVAVIISLLLSVNLLYIFIMTRLVFFDNILFKLPFSKQLIGVSVITLFPIANIIWIFFVAYYISNLEAQKRFNVQEDLKVSISDIEFFLRRGEYEKIQRELKYVESSADQLD